MSECECDGAIEAAMRLWFGYEQWAVRRWAVERLFVKSWWAAALTGAKERRWRGVGPRAMRARRCCAVAYPLCAARP